MSDKPSSNRSKVTVQEARILVSPAQSSKLATLRAKAEGMANPPASVPTSVMNPALSTEVAVELAKARKLIDERYAAILASYPKNKQNKLFSLRFGSIETLKALPVSMIFKRLELDTQLLNFRLLSKLNYHGQTSE